MNKQVESTLDAFAAKIQAVKDDVEFVSDQLDFWDRLQAPGDSEYDFYFGAEGHTPDEASKLWIHNSISSISVELQHLFARGLQRTIGSLKGVGGLNAHKKDLIRPD